MLRYYLHDGSSAFRFKLSGALTGADVAELEQCWRTALSTIGGRNFLVDVSELTVVDDAGRALLELWRRSGAQFQAASAESRLLIGPIIGHAFIPAATRRARRHGRFSGRLAAIAAVMAVTLLLPATVLADDNGAPSPDLVLSRYTAAAERHTDRIDVGVVVMDIEASLPKLQKKGRLQAIRRLIPFGRPEYKVLESEGDRVVKEQVIARYLSADAQAQALPSTVAVSPANYKFHFIGAIGNEPTLAYVYRIKPRKKRVGLMQGELWIDVATGVAMHQAGRLVKRPSVFLRRVDIVQDTYIRDGSPELRITHLSIDTRLVGHAELTITEHPDAAPISWQAPECRRRLLGSKAPRTL